MMAIVPSHLMASVEARYMMGNLYSINHFKLYWNPYGCPTYEGYNFFYDDYSIAVTESTQFILLEPSIDFQFPVYPFLTSIETLVKMQRRRLLIGKFK